MTKTHGRGQQIQLSETGKVMAVHKVIDIKAFTEVYVCPNTRKNICATSRLTAMGYTVICGPANQHWIMKNGWRSDDSPYLEEVLCCETLQGMPFVYLEDWLKLGVVATERTVNMVSVPTAAQTLEEVTAHRRAMTEALEMGEFLQDNEHKNDIHMADAATEWHTHLHNVDILNGVRPLSYYDQLRADAMVQDASEATARRLSGLDSDQKTEYQSAVEVPESDQKADYQPAGSEIDQA